VSDKDTYIPLTLEKYTDTNEHVLYIAGLIHKAREKETLSPEEQTLLRVWRETSLENEQLFHRLQDREYLETELRALLQIDYRDSATELYEKLGISQTARIKKIKRTWLSAAALLLVCAGLYIWLRPASGRKTSGPQPFAARTDVAPGKQGAILTLTDGSTVVLDSLGNGPVAVQGGSKVMLNSGQLTYGPQLAAHSSQLVAYNTMTTPKGRQFQLMLPDGTKVWLNAASSIHFPIAFTGNTRSVDITGEAYFEVAQDKRKPFHVKFKAPVGGEGEVEVLGTHFNINSYSDEATANTTLLEGSVRIIHGSARSMLQPGQQAQLSTTQTIRIINNADIEKIMAWKNGVFDFQDATLEEVMRQLQRWYDIEVVYEKDVPRLEFIGRMGRDLPLSKVLNGLEASKVHFRLEGRRLIVLP
jgi:ferric-dicitrate binding protein FerR (iron transport regulator)